MWMFKCKWIEDSLECWYAEPDQDSEFPILWINSKPRSHSPHYSLNCVGIWLLGVPEWMWDDARNGSHGIADLLATKCNKGSVCKHPGNSTGWSPAQHSMHPAALVAVRAPIRNIDCVMMLPWQLLLQGTGTYVVMFFSSLVIGQLFRVTSCLPVQFHGSVENQKMSCSAVFLFSTGHPPSAGLPGGSLGPVSDLCISSCQLSLGLSLRTFSELKLLITSASFTCLLSWFCN